MRYKNTHEKLKNTFFEEIKSLDLKNPDYEKDLKYYDKCSYYFEKLPPEDI